MDTSHPFGPVPAASRRAGWISFFGAMVLLAGCGAGAGNGNGGNSISVSITNKVTSVQAGTVAIVFTAAVQNDSSNSGVTWSLAANGNACSPICGTLSQATSAAVTYTPPASTPAAPNNQATLTATSVAKANKSDADPFTISPALAVSITNAFVSVNTGASPFVVNATVQNDSTNSGVSWTLVANGVSCPSACGTLSGATTTSVTYSPPSSVPTAPNNQPTIKATSVSDASKSDADAFTIQKPPITVTIKDKLNSVNANAGTISFSASLQNDTTNPFIGVNWSLTVSGANCQPACGTLSNQGFSTIAYTPPGTAPASAPGSDR